MKWSARLQGHSFDLETLALVFCEGDPKVSVDRDGNYVVESAAFDSFTEAGDVHARRSIFSS